MSETDEPPGEIDEPGLDRTFARFRLALCGPTMGMVVLSWPLWVDGNGFPRVPFFPKTPELPAWVSWLLFGLILVTLGLATLGIGWRSMLRVGLPVMAFSIVQDQGRFQPWAYQYLVVGLSMAWMTRAGALRVARWYACSLYLYSGLSKLDASFCRELGPTFLSTALGFFGLSMTTWTEAVRTLACLGLPAFEIAVAVMLMFPRTRRVGLVGAVAQHAALVMILSPWGLGHSPIVLAWNLAFLVQDLILFGRVAIPIDPGRESRAGRWAGRVVWLAMLLPLGERLGFCDAWPGHALYASHAERSDIFLHEDDLDLYPEPVRRRSGPPGVTPWRRLDLTGWSRDVRGTPPYPSGRVANAVAESLAMTRGVLQPVRLVQWGRARPWDVSRDRDESLGLAAIRKRADRFTFHAHPAGLDRD